MLILWQQANVIIHNKVACLTEYGLFPILCGDRFSAADTPGSEGMQRWQAPEILIPPRSNGEAVYGSEPADVFAFAMLAAEVFTGRVPFGETVTKEVATRMITDGHRPELPAEIEEQTQMLIGKCWNKKPKKRPDVGNVVANLESLLNGRGLGKSIPIPGDHILIR